MEVGNLVKLWKSERRRGERSAAWNSYVYFRLEEKRRIIQPLVVHQTSN